MAINIKKVVIIKDEGDSAITFANILLLWVTGVVMSPVALFLFYCNHCILQ